MGKAKVIKPAQPLDKDPAEFLGTVSCATFGFISTCCVLGGLLIFVQFRDIGLMENVLGGIYAFSQENCF